MDAPTAPGLTKFDVIEVKFKGGRKEYFRNVNRLELYTGDPVVVEVPSGHHLGYVSLQGELVRLQLLKKNIKDNADLRTLYRKATPKDLERHQQALARDLPTMYRAREIIHELKLNMKLSDVEFQADNAKAIFYYSSEDRVDFRELIKMLAGEFKIRVEMKQISLRQEAGRIGGLGVCGRELCCSTWLTDFKNVTTSAARYQNLSLNPVKLSGQCGRLKCCLNYELETYMDALKGIPSVDRPLQVDKGDAFLQKTDIFRRLMWFSFKGDNDWYVVPVARVKEIIALNKQGIVPPSFQELERAVILPDAKPVAINSDLQRMDEKYRDRNARSKRGGRNKKKKEGSSETPEVRSAATPPAAPPARSGRRGPGKPGGQAAPKK